MADSRTIGVLELSIGGLTRDNLDPSAEEIAERSLKVRTVTWTIAEERRRFVDHHGPLLLLARLRKRTDDV
jgi:hypothetical protein